MGIFIDDQPQDDTQEPKPRIFTSPELRARGLAGPGAPTDIEKSTMVGAFAPLGVGRMPGADFFESWKAADNPPDLSNLNESAYQSLGVMSKARRASLYDQYGYTPSMRADTETALQRRTQAYGPGSTQLGIGEAINPVSYVARRTGQALANDLPISDTGKRLAGAGLGAAFDPFTYAFGAGAVAPMFGAAIGPAIAQPLTEQIENPWLRFGAEQGIGLAAGGLAVGAEGIGKAGLAWERRALTVNPETGLIPGQRGGVKFSGGVPPPEGKLRTFNAMPVQTKPVVPMDAAAMYRKASDNARLARIQDETDAAWLAHEQANAETDMAARIEAARPVPRPLTEEAAQRASLEQQAEAEWKAKNRENVNLTPDPKGVARFRREQQLEQAAADAAAQGKGGEAARLEVLRADLQQSVAKATAPEPVPQPPRDPYELSRAALRKENEPIVRKIGNFLMKVRVNYVDPNAPLTNLERKSGIPVHQLAQLAAGGKGTGAGSAIIEQFYVPVLKPVANNLADLEHLMTLRRDGDLLKIHPDTALPGGLRGRAEVNTATEGIRRRVGEETFDRLNAAADGLTALNRQYSVRARQAGGLITREAADAMIASHPNYIPFQRADYAEMGRNQFRHPTASVSTTGVKAMNEFGSARNLESPLTSLISEPIRVQNLLARNNAGNAIVDSLQRVDPASISMKGGQAPTQDTLSVFRNGEQMDFHVPALYGRVARGLDRQPDTPFIFRLPAQIVRAGTTQYNPAFIPINVIRDGLSIHFNAKTTILGPDYWAGIQAVVSKNTLYREAQSNGVYLSGVMDNLAEGGKAVDLRRLTQGAVPLESVKDYLLAGPRGVEAVNQVFERAARTAVYRKLIRDGVTATEAAVRARDATVDFGKAGHHMRVINQVVPFSNASLQGSINVMRTIRDHPKWAAAAGLIYASPTILTRVNNMRFASSKDIPDDVYARTWPVQFGEAKLSDGTVHPLYVAIPKGDVGSLLTFPVEALMSLARKNDDRSAIDMLLTYGRNSFGYAGPNLPFMNPNQGIVQSAAGGLPGISTAASLWANKDTYTGMPIESRGQELLAPEQRFGNRTSTTAIALGQRFQVSPEKIDYAIRDTTGGAGQTVNWLADLGLQALGYQSPPVYGAAKTGAPTPPTGIEQARKVPVVGRFLGTRSSQESNMGWDAFGKAHEDSQRAFSKIPGMTAMGQSLGDVQDTLNVIPGASKTALKLTPGERAKLQDLYASLAIPAVAEAAKTLRGTDEQRQAVIDKLKKNARTEAEWEFGPKLTPPPGDVPMQRAFAFRDILDASGYIDVERDNPTLRLSPTLAARYRLYTSLPDDTARKAAGMTQFQIDDMKNIGSQIDARKQQLRLTVKGLDVGLVRYGLSSSFETRAGEVEKQVRDQQQGQAARPAA